MSGVVAGLILLAVLVLGMVVYADHEGDKAAECRKAGGVLIRTVDFANGSVCARIEVIR